MQTQMKQRIVGIIVLLVLIAAILLLLFYGMKQSGNGNSRKPIAATIALTEKSKMQSALSKDDAKNIAEAEVKDDGLTDDGSIPLTLKKITPKLKQIPLPVVSDRFGQLTYGDNLSEKNKKQVSVIDGTKNKIAHEVVKNKSIVAKTTAKEMQKEILSDKKRNSKKMVKRGQKQFTKVITKTWSVQMASFSAPKNAQNLLKKFRAKNYHAYTRSIKTAKHGVVTQVLVGPIKSKSEANRLAKVLEKQFKLKGLIICASSQKK